MSIRNISAYRFTPLTGLETLRQNICILCEPFDVLGTILLSEEGFNLNLALPETQTHALIGALDNLAMCKALRYKYSVSDTIPFQELKIKIKPEIITYRRETAKPSQHPVDTIDAKTLKAWYQDKKDFAIVDTRNTYETAEGAFDNAVKLDIENFTEFHEAINDLDPALKDKPVVIYCTGGVRCEKAGISLHEKGFKHVYQLEGGILQYFSECGDSFYQDSCFVFDDRVTVTAKDVINT